MGLMLAGDRDATVNAWARVGGTILSHFWFKCLGTVGFTTLFFVAYVYLLRHPALAVHIVPTTVVDDAIGFVPQALPIYLSLWLYVSLPPMLVMERRQVAAYGAWMGALCLCGLAIFYFLPNAVPPMQLPWDRYPGMAFLKTVDAAGNACPSLHVACAVFAAVRLHQRIPELGLGRPWRWAGAIWCVAIAWSTLATKQHVALDVLAGAALGGAFGLASMRFSDVRRSA